MLLSLAEWLQTLMPQWGFLRVFQYITFRAVMAALTALLIGLIAGPTVIRHLTALKIGQPVRAYAMQSHLVKSGTPTMGGVLVLIGIFSATLLWADWHNRFIWIVLIVTMAFGAIGWVGRRLAQGRCQRPRGYALTREVPVAISDRLAGRFGLGVCDI